MEKSNKSKEILYTLEDCIAKGYTIKGIDKDPNKPNEYIVSNSSLYEYLKANKDFRSTISGLGR